MAKEETKKSSIMPYLILAELVGTGWLMYISATAKPRPWRVR